MKTKINVILLILALLAYFIGLRTANAFYDPGMQRWLNRDPIQEDGGINLYNYLDNEPQGQYDAFGLAAR